jgi:nitrous oxidase accessory protein
LDGAVLCLEPGEYAGPVRLTRPVTLWGPRGAVVRSSGEGSTVRVEADGVRLQGFSVAGSGRRFEQTDAAVLLRGCDLSAEGLHISGALFGISVERSARVRLAGNQIIGTGGKDLGLRGDAIRFWEVHDSVIEDNLVRESRDIVVWYSPDNLMRGNRVEDGRYGTHFMYSSRNAVRDNVYLGNVVGVFVMYCDEVEVAGNLVAEAAPPGGMGLGLKDAGNVRVLDNRMIRNPVGIYIDTSPVRRDQENRFRGNALDFCDAGIVFHRSETRNAFEGNDLRGCPVPVRVEGGGDARGVRWSGNYFDDYSGYDLDGDGAGDVPYEQRRLSLQLTSRHESLRFFRGTPAFGLLDLVSKVFPVLAPQELLRDESPRMAANLAGEVAGAH